MLRKLLSYASCNPAGLSQSPAFDAGRDPGHILAPTAVLHADASHDSVIALMQLAPEPEQRKKIYASLDNASLAALRLASRGFAEETRVAMLERKYPAATAVKPPNMPLSVYLKALQHVDAIEAQWPKALWDDSGTAPGPDSRDVALAIENGQAQRMLSRCEKHERKPTNLYLLKNLASLRAHLGHDEAALRDNAKIMAARLGIPGLKRIYHEPAAMHISDWAGKQGSLVKQAQYLFFAMDASHSQCGVEGLHPVERHEQNWLREIAAETPDKVATPTFVAALGVIAVRYGERKPQSCDARWREACDAYAALTPEDRPLGFCVLHTLAEVLQKQVPSSAAALLEQV